MEDQLRLISQELKSYGDEFVHYVSSLHSNTFAPLSGSKLLTEGKMISMRSDPKLIIQLMQQDAAALLQDAQKHAKFAEDHLFELEECQSLMNVLLTVSEVSEMLGLCEDLIGGSDLPTCARELVKLKDKIDISLPAAGSELGTGQVCRLLRREFSILLSRFRSRCKRLLRACIFVENGKVLITRTLKGSVRDEEFALQSPVPLSDVWLSLFTLDGTATTTTTASSPDTVNSLKEGTDQNNSCFKSCIKEITLEVWTKVLRPLWSVKKVSSPHLVTRNGEDTAELSYESFAKENNFSFGMLILIEK
jgi:hypothetical protein